MGEQPRQSLDVQPQPALIGRPSRLARLTNDRKLPR